MGTTCIERSEKMKRIHSVCIRDLNIPTNVFFAPINPGFANDGIISDDYIGFFAKYSGNGIGICYVGNVALRQDWTTNKYTAVLMQTEYSRWKRLAASIWNQGSVPAIQLAWKPTLVIPQRSFVSNNRSEQIEIFKSFYNNFNDIETMANIFASSIEFAYSCGFPIVQLHAAHGYALSLLLSRAVSGCNNPEKTKGAELIKRIIEKVIDTKIIFDIRVSLYEGIDDGTEEYEYKSQMMRMLTSLGVDIISLSNGFYNIDKKMIYPPKKQGTIILQEVEEFAQKYPDVIWNVAGNMESALVIESEDLHNMSYSLGRQLLVDPQVIEKIQNNQFDKINYCTECNACHYYSFEYEGIRPCNRIKPIY